MQGQGIEGRGRLGPIELARAREEGWESTGRTWRGLQGASQAKACGDWSGQGLGHCPVTVSITFRLAASCQVDSVTVRWPI